jgi:hypothetical protein
MTTELGKICQEMARIEDFASFKSELLGALGGPRPLHEIVSRVDKCFFLLKKQYSYAMYDQVNDINLITKKWVKLLKYSGLYLRILHLLPPLKLVAMI